MRQFVTCRIPVKRAEFRRNERSAESDELEWVLSALEPMYRFSDTGTGPSMDRPVPESITCEQSSSASFYAYGDRSLPARDRSPRAELSGRSQIFPVFAGCAYGDRSLPIGTGS
uniref:Uncharacterized protein n=1 Tax=Ananas comosus var. bracteatus TaxID=296719 RepID=A0A6V7Q3G3_ANACO|nr:unnamed protein product [Ananas comosus var. bracteatus]